MTVLKRHCNNWCGLTTYFVKKTCIIIYKFITYNDSHNNLRVHVHDQSLGWKYVGNRAPSNHLLIIENNIFIRCGYWKINTCNRQSSSFHRNTNIYTRGHKQQLHRYMMVFCRGMGGGHSHLYRWITTHKELKIRRMMHTITFFFSFKWAVFVCFW